MQKSKVLISLFAFAAGFAHCAASEASNYPSRPITMVVPGGAGGTPDVIARILAEHMRVQLGQPIVIENVGGAGGSIAVGRVARATADGHTLSVGTFSSHVVNGAAYSLSYDVFKDFEPIALLPNLPLLIIARKSLPAEDLRQLIAWLKKSPDKASQGIVGSTSQLAGVFFQKLTGTRFQFVPYRSFAAAIQDLTGGRLEIMFTPASNALGAIQSGEIRVFAVTAKNRLAVAPEIPSVNEVGLPEFYFSLWQAIWAPKGTPKPIITKLNAAVVDALADPKVRSRIASLGQEIPPRDQQTPEALGAFHKAEIEKWWPIIKEAGIKVE